MKELTVRKCNCCGRYDPPICPHCEKETEVYSRIVGYFRPVSQWNLGKKEEYKERLEFNEHVTAKSRFK